MDEETEGSEIFEGRLPRLVREQLAIVVRENGVDILDDPRRVKAMLGDTIATARREINLINGALSEGVPERLAAVSGDPLRLRTEIETLTQLLVRNYAWQPEAAAWAVRSCAWTLGLAPAPDDLEPDSSGIAPVVPSVTTPVVVPIVTPAPEPASPGPESEPALPASDPRPPNPIGGSSAPTSQRRPVREFMRRRWLPALAGVLVVGLVAVVAIAAGGSGGGSGSSSADRRAAIEAKLTAATKAKFPPVMRTAVETFPKVVTFKDCDAPKEADSYYNCYAHTSGDSGVGVYINPFDTAADVTDQLDFAAHSKGSSSGTWHDSGGELRGRAVQWVNSSGDAVLSSEMTIDRQRYVVDAYWRNGDQAALLEWWERHSSATGASTFTPKAA